MKISTLQFALVLLGFTRLSAQNGGESDPTFGQDGLVYFNMGDGQIKCSGLIIQDDQKIVISGNSTDSEIHFRPAFRRLNTDGSPDLSFGENGTVYIDTTFATLNDASEILAIQDDGKLVMCYHATIGNTQRIAATRLKADGTLDTSFDSDGTTVNPADIFFENANSILIQEDGKIIVVGMRSFFEGDPIKMIALRFNSDGSPDETFANSGNFMASYSPYQNQFTDAKETSEGKIILLGYSQIDSEDSEIIVLRINSNGTLDASFGTDGVTTINVTGTSSICRSVELDNEGNIFLGGVTVDAETLQDPLVIKLTPEGALDNAFGDGGIVISAISEENETIDELTISTEGKIMAAGHGGFLFNDGLVLRYNEDGTFDSTFGTNGVRLIAAENYKLENIKQQADGKIVVMGTSYDSKADFHAWRIDRLMYDAPINIFEQTSDPGIINVYPNPAQDFVNIDFPSPGFPCEVAIYNLMGQCLRREMIRQSTLKIHTADLAAGMYTLIIEGQAKSSHRCNFLIAR